MSKDNSANNKDNILYLDAYRVDDYKSVVAQVELLTDAEDAATRARLSDKVKAIFKLPKHTPISQTEIDTALTMFVEVMDKLRQQHVIHDDEGVHD